MRLGVLADVHGNLPALEATVDALHHRGVDGFVQLGDLVGYGPFPNECIELVARLDAIGVVGNHELIVRGRLSMDRCTRLARTSLAWTMTALSARSRAYIESLPCRTLVEGAMLATHASLTDPQQYVETSEQAREQLELLKREAPGAKTLLVGHTHRPRAYALDKGELRLSKLPISMDDGAWLLNPGSVGQSREVRARATSMLLDLDRRTATLLSLEYDEARTRHELRRHGLDPSSHHSPPAPLARVSRAVRRLVAHEQ